MFLVIIGLALVISQAGLTRWVLYLPPVALPLLMWSVFRRTLAENQTALITQIATATHGQLSDALCNYTHRLTALWCHLFLALALGSAILPFVASEHAWSLFTNFIAWLIIGVFFVVEFVYRQWRYRQVEHPSFWRYVQIVVQADVRNLG